jgi:hypothetical protein
MWILLKKSRGNSAHREARDVVIIRRAPDPLPGSGFNMMWVIGNRAL